MDKKHAAIMVRSGKALFIERLSNTRTIFAARIDQQWRVFVYNKCAGTIDYQILGHEAEKYLRRGGIDPQAAERKDSIALQPAPTPIMHRPQIIGWAPIYHRAGSACRSSPDDTDKPLRRSSGGGKTQKIARFLMERDGKKCVYCQAEVHLPVYGLLPVATIDHLLPKSKGGTDDLINLVLACRECNQSKADAMPAEYMKKIWGEYLEKCPHDIKGMNK